MARMQREDQLRVKQLLTDAITILCKNGLTYKAEFSIEGLLGITLDQNEIFLVNIKENIKFNKDSENKADDHDIAQAVQAVANTCHLPFGDVSGKVLDFTASLGTSADVTTTVFKNNEAQSIINVTDDEGDNDLSNLNIAEVSNLKCNDLDILLANLAGQKKRDDSMEDATANSIFSALELDQIIAGGVDRVSQSKDASSSESETEAEVVVVKQEGCKKAKKSKKRKAADSLDVDDIQATVTVIGELPMPSIRDEALITNLQKDVHLPSYSAWDGEEEVLPLNLTPVAQDLTTKKKKVMLRRLSILLFNVCKFNVITGTCVVLS